MVLFELRPAGHGGVSLAIGREIACQVEALRWERVDKVGKQKKRDMWVGHKTKGERGGAKFGGLMVRGKHWLLFSLQKSGVWILGSGMRTFFLIIIGNLWGQACAGAGMKARD